MGHPYNMGQYGTLLYLIGDPHMEDAPMEDDHMAWACLVKALMDPWGVMGW